MIDSSLRRTLRTVSRLEIELEIDGRPVLMELRRSPRARRIRLAVPPATGVPVLTVPQAADVEQALAFAAGQGAFLERAVARLGRRVRLRDGATIPLRGDPHMLLFIGGHHRPVTAIEEPRAILVSGDRRHFGRRLHAWLRAQARADLEAAVARHAVAAGVTPARIALRDPRTRWGSCSARGTLSFSWRLILAPAFVLDYLAAHEVAHLKHMNHGPDFWRLVKRLDPGTDRAEAWLRREGHTLHRYVVETDPDD